MFSDVVRHDEHFSYRREQTSSQLKSVSDVKYGWYKYTSLQISSTVFILAISSLVRESYGSAVFMAD